MKTKMSFCLIILFWAAGLQAQKKITLEEIWGIYKFRTESAGGFRFLKDGSTYIQQDGKDYNTYNIVTGSATGSFFNHKNLGKGIPQYDEMMISSEESKLIFATETESIYRYSSKSFHFIQDLKTNATQELYPKAKQLYPEISPVGDKVAFIANNNLIVKDLASNVVVPVTKDGVINQVINGLPDWVYEEEFSMYQAYQWSPDGKFIGFLRFDESGVKQYSIDFYNDGEYPEPYIYKYPKVGEANAIVSAWIYELSSGKLIRAEIPKTDDDYLPRIKWTPDSKSLCVTWMNRLQNELKLYLTDPNTGSSKIMLSESNKAYIDITDNLSFLADGKSFIWTSEMDGYNHIYLYDINGKLIRQLTKGMYDVTAFYGMDENKKWIYFQAAMENSYSKEVYRVSLKGDKLQKISSNVGTNAAEFSKNFDYMVLSNSTFNSPPVYQVCSSDGKSIRILEENKKTVKQMEEYGVKKVEAFSFKTSENIELFGWMIKPEGAGINRKQYPVLMFQYSGPNSQEAKNEWMGTNYWWFQMLVQQGYIVACVDGRGTGARGEAFRKVTYLQLGHYEVIDQIEAAKYLGSLSYVDPARIGIWGWSYGGYMSSLCILKGNDVFKAAIAVAPVTNWKWYDSIYTERYMRTTKENPAGYRENSPVYFADKLKGKYLLIHGTADDNVHFQNSVEMSKALIAANKQFDTYYYPNKNHGIYGGPTRLHLYQKMTDFINQNL